MVGKGRHFVGLLVKDHHFVSDFVSHFVSHFVSNSRFYHLLVGLGIGGGVRDRG